MAFKLDGKPLAVDVPFTSGDINYPANWLRLSTAQEKKDLGITEVDDPKTYDSRFYNGDGTARELDDVDAKDKDGKLLKNEDGSQMVIQGVKSRLKAQEKIIAGGLLARYDWQVVRKAEKGTAMDSNVITYRDGIRTAYTTRKTEITNCANTAALVTLYGSTEQSDKTWKPNMTQYPEDDM
tara:strand:- start:475 stop:1017 length:543 start_codon:yes stop_codon:yes gene_type:complete